MSAQASPYKVHSREITQKASKGEQPFLHATHRLDPIYMPTKYYQNISKGIKVIERTSFCLRTDRRTDRRTDGQTDGRQADRYIPRSFSGRGIKIKKNPVFTVSRDIYISCHILQYFCYLFSKDVLLPASKIINIMINQFSQDNITYFFIS